MSGLSSEPSTRSDGKFLYIFTRMMGTFGYILYRTDALKLLYEHNDQQFYDLQPFLIFSQPILPESCTCTKMESN